VVRELETVSIKNKTTADTKFNHLLKNIHHSFYDIKNEDVINGINDFVEEQKMDMVVMIPQTHSGFKNLFTEPHTKRMAFHIKTPLLALHQ
jgi:hypothetical protein